MYGASGEDKLHDASSSQGQLVASMILTATMVGKVAINKKLLSLVLVHNLVMIRGNHVQNGDGL